MKKAFAIMVVATVMGTAAFAEGMFSAGLILVPNFSWETEGDSKGSTAGFGFGAYFDAKYVAVNIGFNSVSLFYDGEKFGDPSNSLTFGLLGKYPIAIGEKFSIAPALGFEYQMFLNSGSMTRADMDDMGMKAEDIDRFVLKFGALADYTIFGGLYVRAGLLLDLGLARKDAKDSTFGFEIPIGIGYRF